MVCPELENMAKSVTKCKGLLVCYESDLTNPFLIGKQFLLPKLYQIRTGTSPRFCKDLILNKEQWNGFVIFQGENSNDLEVKIDIAGRYATFTVPNETPTNFLQALSSDHAMLSKSNYNNEIFKIILETIEEKMDIKSFWVGFSVKGIRLEEALDFAGFVVLEKDLSFKSDGTKMRNVHIKHHQDDTCKETTTTTATTTTPTTTTMPNCRHYTQGALYYDKYSCHCGSTNETDVKLNKCCNLHHECLNELLKECPSIPPAKHFVDIDTTKYEMDSGLFETRKEIKCKEQDPCQKQLCECDRWEPFILLNIK
uniref:Phospholipase A2-like central domain-containing protein n=1 Tax=Meloidogyne enterolobii TaxID=390850 RepID=A0A6V7U315_MELEN|nr:unnamed protein product [Meloidogyne enterolobii]